MLILNREEVKKCLSMKEAIEAMRSAFKQLTLGEAVIPLRTGIQMEKNMGSTRFMPVYLAGSDQAGIKIASNFKTNRSKGLPTLISAVFLFDPRTGEPLALMDSTYLTALRTGAASGLATSFMANPNSRVLAIFGAGAQGRTQLQAVCDIREIDQIWVFDVDQYSAERFVEEARSWSGSVPPDIRVARTSQEAVEQADVICTATTSPLPLFEDRHVKAGAHINGVGSFTPQTREIGTETVCRSRIVVDHRATALAEAGDLLIPIQGGVLQENDIHAELGELVLGRKQGRKTREEITFFKSVGLAVQDLAVGMKVLERAIEKKMGVEVSLL
jgi:alanine dehydrogenase